MTTPPTPVQPIAEWHDVDAELVPADSTVRGTEPCAYVSWIALVLRQYTTAAA